MKIKSKVKSFFDKISFDSFSNFIFDKPIIYYWDHEKNWGDSINKFIFESILGKEVLSASRVFNFKNQEIITGIGSVLNSRLSNYSIWGSGFLSEYHGLISPPNKVLAVRGKLTQRKIKNQFAIDCDLLGDPGLLFKDFYNPDLRKEYSVGIIPHFKELDLTILREVKGKYGEEIPIISPALDIIKFADKVKQCEKILSSSLHGLILAESYGIPTARIILSDRLVGGDFKFEDYYSGVGIDSKVAKGFSIQSVEYISRSTTMCSSKDLNYSKKHLIETLSNHFT